jgi:RimJ/RimL family protein N-acetyltransferase
LLLVPQTREAVRAQLESMPPEQKREVSGEWLKRLEMSGPADPWIHGFKIQLKEPDLPVGQCGFKGPPDGEGMVEIAYGINPEQQRKGYATEAAAALVRFAFNDPQVRLVRAHTLRDGNASIRVLRKCGFHLVGEVLDPEDGLVFRWELDHGHQPPPLE